MWGGSGNWCGIVLVGRGHYLVRDGGHWPQMSETEQICAVNGGGEASALLGVSTGVGGGMWDGYLVGHVAGICNRGGMAMVRGCFCGC